MRSPTTFNRNSGNARAFTLIETVVVMTLIAVIGGFTAVVSLDSYRSHAFRGDRDMLVSALQRARSQSVNNICQGAGCTNGKSHGIEMITGAPVIFQGSTYAGRDVVADEHLSFAYSTNILPGSLTEVVFTQLSAGVANPGDIILGDNTGRTSTISINGEGRISWTN